MKIALAQIDTLVGDLEGNAGRIREATEAARAKGADLVVFPELTVTGYDPRDYLRMPAFLEAAERTVRALAAPADWNRDVGVVVGFPEAGPPSDGAAAYNACALLEGGSVRAVARKTLLPSYDVLEEPRHFESAGALSLATFRGRRLGLTICEDAWNSRRFHPRRRYPRDPVAELAGAGAEVIINLSASPFHAGKPAFRKQMFSDLAKEHQVPVVVVNAVGGNDGIVFDGHSLAFLADGTLAAQGAGFEEDLPIFDTGAPLPGGAGPPQDDDLAQIHAALVLGIRDYCRKVGFRRVVLGLSGGIDSALVAALAAEALGPSAVLAVTMPSRYSSEGSVTDSEDLARALGIELRNLPIEGPFTAYLDALEPEFGGRAPDVTEENLQSRVRGTYLMALSNKLGHLLLATGNKSELAVGYATLYGDMAGGLAPLGDVLKTGAYALSRRINAVAGRPLIPEAILEKPPSAELKPDQRDQDSLPPYAILDPIVTAFVEEGLSGPAIVDRGFDEATVRRVLGLIVGAEYKRRQAAPVIKVSRAPFVSGWRLPLAQGWRPWAS